MKRRIGFVSNSSSSSFIISRQYLSYEQIDKIKNHIDRVERFDDRWHIDEEEDYIKGYCDMDNFNMREYLENIGVNMEKVSWR
jgi:hypothetical protein